MSKEDLLEQIKCLEKLEELHNRKTSLDISIDSKVRDCLEAGIPRKLVAEALGVSEQAVYKRYRRDR